MKDIYTSYHDALAPLLESLQWKGSNRQILEAMPSDQDAMDLQGLRDTLSHLGFTSIIKSCDAKDIPGYCLPALCSKGDKIHLLQDREEADMISGNKLDFIIFTRKDTADLTKASMSILRYEMKKFMPLLREVLLISLIVGFISIAPIFYNRSIYDHIIASGSTKGFPMLFGGVMLALAAEIGLRYMRNQRLAYFGGRIDHYVSCSVFERLLFLSPVYTERSPVSAQLARLRDFESVREFFTGPLSTVLFEFPLIAIYLLAMGVIAGWLTLVPIVLIIAYAVLIFTMNIRLKTGSRLAASTSTRRQEFLLEMITKLRDIRLAGLEKVWQERYRVLSGQASLASFHSAFSAQVLETTSYAFMIIGGAATLGIGVVMVIEHDMTVGTLIAAMMLIWRIIAPMQIACASMTRIQQLSSSTRQVERLLSAIPEHDPALVPARLPDFRGAISFHRVSLKYTAESEPALLGVSLDVKPGQVVAIKGNNGSGKSSILKLILGLYQPQAGSVRIDGMDIRQFDPFLLRQGIAYVPQHGDFFPGTIRDNLMFSNPDATQEEIDLALRESCAYDDVMALPLKLETVIHADNHSVISFALRGKLNLARAYVRKAPIYLFDEASYSLGRDNDIAFEQKIKSLRGKATIIIVTHREDHMCLADYLVNMSKGEMTHAGAPQQVLNVLKGKKQ